MHKTYTITKASTGPTQGRFFWEKFVGSEEEILAIPEEEKGICFIPEFLIEGGELDTNAYLDTGWARTSCGSQPQGCGSHMFPDMKKPVLEDTPEQTDRIKKFLEIWR